MRHRIRGFACGLLLAAGCAAEEEPAREARRPAGEVRAPTSTPVPPPDSVPAFELTWDTTYVLGMLRSADVDARIVGRVRQPFMNVPGLVVRIRNEDGETGEVQVYLYGDAVARSRDSDRLDPVRVAPPGVMPSWRVTPALVASNNMVAIVLVEDEELRAHVRRALTLEPSEVGYT